MTVLQVIFYAWLSYCLVYLDYCSILCSTLFASGLYESYHFLFFYFSYCYFLFYFYVTLVFFSFVLVLIVIAFPTVIFSHIISCLPGEWALLTFVFKSLSSEKRIILVNERLEGSDGRRVGGKQQCFSGSYFKEKTLHYDWLRVGPRYWIYWIQFKWSFKIKYYCFKKQ